MHAIPRMPGLALPFTIVGAAAGWLSAGFLANPLVDIAYGGKQPLAALCAGAVCGATGALIRRSCGPRLPWEDHRPWARLTVLVLMSGAVCGAAVGHVTGWRLFGAITGAVNGLACAAAFLPVCALVLAAAQRAERARFGSLVAASDRRAVWQIMAAALAAATLAALPDWPAARAGSTDMPYIAGGLAVIACIAVAALRLADALTLRRAGRASGDSLEPRADDDGEEGAIPRVDLGLGDEVRARVDRRTAYRDRERPIALLLGNVEQARGALALALRRGTVCLALTSAVLAAHAWARSDGALAAYRTVHCLRGSASTCEELVPAMTGGVTERVLATATQVRKEAKRRAAQKQAHRCALRIKP